MSYESTAEPIKIGYLMDFLLPENYPQDLRDDLTNPFDMVFGDAFVQGKIDRPIEILYRESKGSPKDR
jgi:branched-chain amino acid transport system substrate-binding protein